jgi:tetratricopeptide (TPR) repeat protein
LVEARKSAESYLGTPIELRSEVLVADVLAQSDTLLSICSLLKARVAVAPADVYAEGSLAYGWVVAQTGPVGLFDERDFFLGELASLTSSAARYLGRLQDCEKWLDRADAAFRHTVNPAPLLAGTAYARLALKHQQGRHDEVLELLPWLETSFIRLGMNLELAKARFLRATTLKQLGRSADALALISSLCEEPAVRSDSGLAGQSLVALGELRASLGDFTGAISAFQQALPVVSQPGRSFVGAELKWAIGDACRASSKTLSALEAYQEALDDYRALGMECREALLRLVVGEVFLQIGRPREAEWQVLAALPVIDREKMVPEGFAAVALLRDSVATRQTNANALVELREYLQAKN